MGLLLMLLLGAAAFAPQQAESPVFRAGVTIVKTDVQVVGRSGRAITGLERDDFLVFDENQPQKIEYFGHESEPVDLLLLLDVSGSMQRSLNEMATASRAALAQLHRGDRAAVMLFSRTTLLTQPITDNFQAVESQMRAAAYHKDLGAGTFLNESLVAAAKYLGAQPSKGRRAILVLTDNQGLNYQHPDEEVVRALYAADTVLNAIVLRKGGRPKPVEPGRYTNPDYTPFDVFSIAARSGGEVLEGGKAGDRFQELLERIRSRYGIQYAAPPAEVGQFRHIRVQLSPAARKTHPDAIVRARAGYYVLM